MPGSVRSEPVGSCGCRPKIIPPSATTSRSHGKGGLALQTAVAPELGRVRPSGAGDPRDPAAAARSLLSRHHDDAAGSPRHPDVSRRRQVLLPVHRPPPVPASAGCAADDRPAGSVAPPSRRCGHLPPSRRGRYRPLPAWGLLGTAAHRPRLVARALRDPARPGHRHLRRDSRGRRCGCRQPGLHDGRRPAAAEFRGGRGLDGKGDGGPSDRRGPGAVRPASAPRSPALRPRLRRLRRLRQGGGDARGGRTVPRRDGGADGPTLAPVGIPNRSPRTRSSPTRPIPSSCPIPTTRP